MVDTGPEDNANSLVQREQDKEGVFELKGAQNLAKWRNELDGKVRGLETLVDGFKGKVDDLVQQFGGLKEGIEELVLQCDAVEQDYFMALDAVDEEKETVAKYKGFLKNTEVENDLLRQNVPEDKIQFVQAFSQARPW